MRFINIDKKIFNVGLKKTKYKYIKHQILRGWYIFVSKLSINIYTVTTTFVLGLLTTNVIVGYYAIAEKVIRAIVGFFSPLTTTLYPHIVQSVKFIRKHDNYFK